MKNYSVEENKIKIYDKVDFNPQHIFNCGQIFRFQKIGKDYIVYSKDKMARIVEKEEYYVVYTDDEKYFENFFDLKTNYARLRLELSKSKVILPALNFGVGLRILKQDIFETIVSFIISANNNIKRISASIEKLCKKFGTNKQNYFAFPTLSQLSKASIEDLVNAGLGYRAKQLKSTLDMLKFINLDKMRTYSYSSKRKFLISLAGVGDKVADCILLFAFGETSVFPVDTWINKVYNSCFSKNETNRNLIRKNLIEYFGNLAGYAQQYLFYYYRENKLS